MAMFVECGYLDCYNKQIMSERRAFPRKELLQPSELRGIFVPTLTPFKIDHEKVILDTFSHIRQIKRLAQPSSGVSGIFLASNAGQGRDMDMHTLKESVIHGVEAARSVNKDLPVVVGALRKTIDEVIEVAKFAELTGADAVVLSPLYTIGDPERILAAVTSATKLPIILYNNPGFQNGSDLSFEFLEKAKENPSVIGIKDTSGKPEYFSWLLENFRTPTRRVMQGDTKAGLAPSIRQADGMVPVEANIYSEILSAVMDQNMPYSSGELNKVMSFIREHKAEFGGSAEFIKKILVDANIFESSISYPVILT